MIYFLLKYRYSYLRNKNIQLEKLIGKRTLDLSVLNKEYTSQLKKYSEIRDAISEAEQHEK